MTPEQRRYAQRARNTLWTAIWNGTVERRAACEQCSKTGWNAHIDAHHDDYAEALAVRWLCRSCHKQHHLKHGSAKVPLVIAEPAPKPRKRAA